MTNFESTTIDDRPLWFSLRWPRSFKTSHLDKWSGIINYYSVQDVAGSYHDKDSTLRENGGAGNFSLNLWKLVILEKYTWRERISRFRYVSVISYYLERNVVSLVIAIERQNTVSVLLFPFSPRYLQYIDIHLAYISPASATERSLVTLPLSLSVLFSRSKYRIKIVGPIWASRRSSSMRIIIVIIIIVVPLAVHAHTSEVSAVRARYFLLFFEFSGRNVAQLSQLRSYDQETQTRLQRDTSDIPVTITRWDIFHLFLFLLNGEGPAWVAFQFWRKILPNVCSSLVMWIFNKTFLTRDVPECNSDRPFQRIYAQSLSLSLFYYVLRRV